MYLIEMDKKTEFILLAKKLGRIILIRITAILKISIFLGIVFWVGLFLFLSTPLLQAEGSAFNLSEKGFFNLIQEGDEFSGFKVKGKPTYYSPENLFSYINGAAELYLSHGFKSLLSVEWTRLGEEDEVIVLEIYDMGNRKNASTIYEIEKAGKKYLLPEGTESTITNNCLQFYKNSFYVRVISFFPSEGCPSILKEIAHTIEKRIGKKRIN